MQKLLVLEDKQHEKIWQNNRDTSMGCYHNDSRMYSMVELWDFNSLLKKRWRKIRLKFVLNVKENYLLLKNTDIKAKQQKTDGILHVRDVRIK